MKLKWLSKNFGLHDPEVLDTLELVLPKYKDILRDNEIKIAFNCNLCSEHKIYVKTTYMKEGDFYFVAFGRIKNFDLESCVGSGRYTFEEEYNAPTNFGVVKRGGDLIMKKYFFIDGFEKNIEFFDTEEQAKKAAEDYVYDVIGNGYDDFCEVEDFIDETYYGVVLGKPILKTRADQTGETEAYVEMTSPKKNVNKWISVNDELPEIEKEVLVYDSYYSYITTSELREYEDEGLKFCSYSYNALDPFVDPNDKPWLPDVTHWQPLPEPPKE